MKETEREETKERAALIAAIIKRVDKATLSELRVVYGYLIA